uniref:THAP domain containing 6 n=1 Tax=Sphenodon punctatus TaxID=8508 RepID=A0A8D0GW28_SPHPU
MVKSCSAVGCASRCLPNSKLKGLTFHVFPTYDKAKRKWVLAMKRLDVNSAGIWEPKKADVLCSRHFKKADFDTRGPNTKLKPGVVPSIFDFPSHLQGRRGKVHCRRNAPLKPLPVAVHNHQLLDAPSSTREFQFQFISEHSYSLSVSPRKLKCQLDQVISELEDAKESLRSALDRERQLKESLRSTVKDLHEKGLIGLDTARILEAYCWGLREERMQEKNTH